MMSPRVVTVVQARLGSTRLPGKVLRPLCGKPLLARLVERVKMATLVGTVVVATTTAAEDDPIEALCHEEGYFCFRGHPTDLLDRHYRAGWQFDADIVLGRVRGGQKLACTGAKHRRDDLGACHGTIHVHLLQAVVVHARHRIAVQPFVFKTSIRCARGR